MKKIILFLSLASVILASPAFAATILAKPTPPKKFVAVTVAAPIPCDRMAAKIATAMRTTKIKDTKLVSAGRHYKAGIALCKVKKNLNADIQFSIALELLDD